MKNKILHRCLTVFSCALMGQGATYADHPTLSLDKGNAGPLTTISAVPLEQGALGFILQYQLVLNDELSDEELAATSILDEEIHSVKSISSTSLAGAFGLLEDFTIGFSLPYVVKKDIREAHHEEDEHDDGHEETGENHHDEGSGIEDPIERLGDAGGMGDLTVYGQYRFWHGAEQESDAALIFGIKTPTGSTDEINAEGMRFDTEHQPGSSSWDLLGGMAFSRNMKRMSISANFLYTFAGDGSQNTNLGDIFNYNLAMSWRLRGNDEHTHSHVQEAHQHIDKKWDFILELNGDRREKVKVMGQADNNSGGNVVYLSVATRAIWGRGWAASFSVGVPVIKNFNGIQSEPEVRLLLGISKSL